MKPINCHSTCGNVFTGPGARGIENCPKCGRHVGPFIRRLLSQDALDRQKEDARSGRHNPSSFHSGNSAWGVKGW